MCFSLDASRGNVRANSAILYGFGNKLYIKDCPGLMIGVGYSEFTESLGLGPGLIKAGSLMGLASYGNPSKDVIKNIDKYIKESIFGIETKTTDYVKYYKDLFKKWDIDPMIGKNKSFKVMTTIAANIQYIFEKSILSVVNNINNKNKDNEEIVNLCLSGGSFLNCNVNSLIKNESKFKNIHHFPACTDDGIALGAALYVAHTIFNEPRSKYSIKDISYCGIEYEYVEPDYDAVAKLIANGKIVGWFMGASECGPRALGNRSILADPRNFHNRELINFTIKRREWFRPLAPSVLEEECSKWFDFNGTSPYMLYTAKVLKPELLPAITHIDGTARMQTVNEETNPAYYKLIKKFYEITGIPMVLNTSLNGMNETILETEEDAMEFFKKSSIDAMVISGKLYTKE
jgi:carbamoyltransferase